MTRAAELRVDIVTDASKAKAGIRQAETGLTGFAGRMKGTFGGAQAKIMAGFAAIGAAKIFGDSIAEAREAAKTMAATNAVIKSTGGAAGVTAQHVANLATELSNMAGVDDEAIQGSENLLMTFTQIKGTNFDAATKAVLDLSAATGTDLNSAAIQVGKALNDPVKGITALTRVGVSFTKQQKDQINAMVKAGDVAGAQALILKELGKEFGGAAAAAADPMDKLKVSVGNAEEAFGTALLPTVNACTDVLAKFFTLLANNQGAMTAFLAIIAAMTLAWIAYNVAQGLAALGLFVLTAPIAAVVIGVAALIAVIVICVLRFKVLRTAAIAVWNAIVAAVRAAVNGIRAAWNAVFAFISGLLRSLANIASSVWATITGAATRAAAVVRSAWASIVGFFSGIASAVGRAMSSVFNAIISPFQKAMSWIRNNFHLPKIDLNPFKAAMATPPAAGGTFTTPTARGGGRAGGTTNITVNVRSGPLSSPTQTGQAVVDALRAWQRGNGPLPVAVR
jgi:hypothetical protein